MSHEIFDELCAVHAFESLDGDDLRLFEEHIRSGCRLCEDALRDYRESMRALPLSNAAPQPASALRHRIAGITRAREFARFRLFMAAAAVFVALLGVYVAVQPPPVMLTSLHQKEVCDACHMKVFWTPGSKEVRIESEHCCPAPPGKQWQLWLVSNGRCIPAGMFNPDSDGHIRTSVAVHRAVDKVEAFAVTAERRPEDQPTGVIVMRGP